MMDRREFLRFVSVLTGGSVAAGALEARAAGGLDLFSDGHRRETMWALFEILLPSEDCLGPSANDAKAIELFRGDKFVKTAVQLGQFPALAADFAGIIGHAMEKTAVDALDGHPLTKTGQKNWFGLPVRKAFKEIPKTRQRAIVSLLLKQRRIVPRGDDELGKWRRRVQGEVIELARTTALFAYAGGVLTEAGLTGGLKWPRYQDFKRGKHNAGFPVVDDPLTGRSGFSYNRVPEANGRRAEPWGDALGNPW